MNRILPVADQATADAVIADLNTKLGYPKALTRQDQAGGGIQAPPPVIRDAVRMLAAPDGSLGVIVYPEAEAVMRPADKAAVVDIDRAKWAPTPSVTVQAIPDAIEDKPVKG
jgi:hypothetical protein